MTQTAHTPAPWVEFADLGDTVAILPAMRDGEICRFSKPFPSRANARLIAAAPDLLWLAERAISIRLSKADWTKAESERSWLAWEEHARAAIAKAKGE